MASRSLPSPVAALCLFLAATCCVRAAEAPAELPVLRAAYESALLITSPEDRANALTDVARDCAAAGVGPPALEALDAATRAAQACIRPALYQRRIAEVRRTLAGLGYGPDAALPDTRPRVERAIAEADEAITAGRNGDALDALGRAVQELDGVEELVQRNLLRAQVMDRYLKLGEATRAEKQAAALLQSARSDPEDVGAQYCISQALIGYAALGRPQLALPLAGEITNRQSRVRALLTAAVALPAGQTVARDEMIDLAFAPATAPPLEDLLHLLNTLARGWGEPGTQRIAAVAVFQRMEQFADATVSRNERARVRRDIAGYYAYAGAWKEAARVADAPDEEPSRCRYLAHAAVETAEGGDPIRAAEMIASLDMRFVSGLPADLRRQLYDVLARARPDATVAEVRAGCPPALLDGTLRAYALAAARRGDGPAALVWIDEMPSETPHEKKSRDDALTDVFRMLSTSADPAATVPSVERALAQILSIRRGVEVLYLAARTACRQEDDDRARELLGRMADTLKGITVPQHRAESMVRMAIIRATVGETETTRKTVREAADIISGIACDSCVYDATSTISREIALSGQHALLPLLAENETLAAPLAWACRTLAEDIPDAPAPTRAALLQTALRGAAQLPYAEDRTRELLEIHAVYRKTGVRAGTVERAILAAARPALSRPKEGADESGETEPGDRIVRLVFFKTRGCASCRDAAELIAQVKAAMPDYDIRVAERMLEGKELENNTAMCRGLDLPETDYGKAPAIFSSSTALIGTEITEERLRGLIEGAVGLRSPERRFGTGWTDTQATRRKYENLTWAVIVLAGLADGVFNPCAFTVIIFFISYLAHVGRGRREIATAGITFMLAVFATYFALGLGLAAALGIGESNSPLLQDFITFGTAAIAALAAILSLRDGILCLKGRSKEMSLALPEGLRSAIRRHITARTRTGLTIGATLVLGAVVAAIELPCTGLMLVPVLRLISFAQSTREYGWGPVAQLFAYNLAFIAPLVLIFFGVYLGLTSEQLTAYFRRHMAKCKFALAGVFALLAVILATLPLWEDHLRA